jgi:peptidoglycan/LPS O-acetylase OafA/YrhL
LSRSEQKITVKSMKNLIFYFAAGCAIGRLIVHGRLRPHWSGPILLIAFLLILGTGSGSEAVETLKGMAGMFFSAMAVLSVIAAAQCRLSGVGSRLAEVLGKSSYGVYILHPLLYLIVSKQPMSELITGRPALVLVVLLSFVLALVLERYYERPIQDRVKRLVSAKSGAPATCTPRAHNMKSSEL